MSGGPSAADQAATAQSQAEAQFYQEVAAEMRKEYGSQTAILNQLRQTYAPFLQAGPGQFGFSPGEVAAMRTRATEGTAQGYAQAARALADHMAATDETGLPSGVGAQLQAGLGAAFAAKDAEEQLQITQQGYQAGANNFLNASKVLSGAAGMMNPAGWANATSNAGNTANQGINVLSKTEQSPWASILGGASALLKP